MQVLSPRWCGLALHQQTVGACVLVTDADGTPHRFVRTGGTMTAERCALGDGLDFPAVTHGARARTGVRWRPVCTVLEEGHPLLLGNAHHRQAVPGRNTAGKDRDWWAEWLRQGLLKASVVPPPPIRLLRDRTR